ncbi:MAG: cytochrome c [Reyranella sp.]|nr:cytochrome c [Reyranella sp.]
MRMMNLLAAAGVVALSASAAQAQSADVARGQAFARANCATCHAIGRTGESPLRAAPSFRTLHFRYPVENLAESLAEGIVTAHPGMPQFRLEVGEIGDLIAYLKTLEG